MRRCPLVLALPAVCAIFFPVAVRAGETKAPDKAGGPYAVEEVRGLAYHTGDGADPVRHQLDVYLPKGQKGFPVLLFVHGGTWQFGNKDEHGPLARAFARNGVGVAVVNYRLSPKVKHPAHIEDVARAFAWAHANIGRYGGRADRIFVCGHSAGGHLVALLATDPGYLAAHKLGLKDIRGVILISGVYTIVPLSMFAPVFGSDEKVCRAASPSNHVKGQHPPALILYAEKEYFLLDAMAERLCKQLRGCDCSADTLKVADRDHVSIIERMPTQTDPALQAALRFLARHADLKLADLKAD